MTKNEIYELKKKLEMLKMHLDHVQMTCMQATNAIYQIEENLMDIEDDILNKKIYG